MLALLALLPFSWPARAQESTAPFDAPLVRGGPYDRYAFLTDFDGDGFQDAVSWWWADPDLDRVKLRGWRNDGTGELVSRWTTTVVLEPLVHVVSPDDYFDGIVYDADGDGDDDFVTDRVIRNAALVPLEGGRRRQMGAGTPGTGGLVPTLGADGLFRVGEPGEVRVRGGVGGAAGVITIAPAHGGAHGPGGWLYPTSGQTLTRIPFRLSGTPGDAGTGSWTYPFTVLPQWAGETRMYTVEIFDPLAAGGVARPNALVVPFGP